MYFERNEILHYIGLLLLTILQSVIAFAGRLNGWYFNSWKAVAVWSTKQVYSTCLGGKTLDHVLIDYIWSLLIADRWPACQWHTTCLDTSLKNWSEFNTDKNTWPFLWILMFACLHHQGNPDARGIKNLWNVGKLLPDYTAQQPRRQPSC
jgi:hypothetical protein